MSHSCSHHHHSHAPNFEKGSFHKAFGFGILLNSLFIAAELFAGYTAHSLALIADAVHNLGDVLSLGLAWLGYALARRQPSARFTFGFGRMSIYATIINGLLLVASSAWIMIEAWERWQSPVLPMTGIVIAVALMGIVINTGTGLLLMRGQHDINIKGAMLHMFGDAAVSAAVAAAALVIGYTGWAWIDPGISFIVALLIILTSWPLLREGFALAMDAVPGSLDHVKILDFINKNQGVVSVAELRIWPLSTTKSMLAAHIIIDPAVDQAALLRDLQSGLQQKFGLSGATLQLEADHDHCTMAHS